MVQGCGVKLIKCMMIFVNTIFFIIGAIIILLASIKLSKGGDDPKMLYGAMSFGCVAFLIGFFGCCGAARESQCLLGLFFICSLLVGLALAGLSSAVLKGKFDKLDGKSNQTMAYGFLGNALFNFVAMICSMILCCKIRKGEGEQAVVGYVVTGEKLNIA